MSLRLPLASATGGVAMSRKGSQGWMPQLSPDGRSILFLTSGFRLRRVPALDNSELLAAPLSLRRLRTTAAAVPVVEGVLIRQVRQAGAADFALSDNGTLVYRSAAERPRGLFALVNWTERLRRRTGGGGG